MTTLKHITSLILLLLAITVAAQDEAFIYGSVTTIDDQTYTGALRWGKEEIYWTDQFNASKIKNENLRYLSREELDYLEDREHSGVWVTNGIRFNWDDWDNDYEFVHQLAVPFGAITSLELIGKNRVAVTLRNGEMIEVSGDGYNDIGTKIRVNDAELGEIEINWSRINRISFDDTPRKLESRFGEPLYGKVFAKSGTYTGLVQWDHDERISTDMLDGDTDDGDVSIEFGKIATIERLGYSRSVVSLSSGRTLELRGSNDVNSENRGIIVTVPGLGRVDIPWDEFERVEFQKNPNRLASYNDFTSQKVITGTVNVVNGDVHEGTIIFDLDEAYGFEVLNGEKDDLSFDIPFEYIQSITPKNYSYSLVKLTSGEELLLGDSQDVTDENDGILILKSNQPVYIPWEKVSSIQLK